MIDILKKMCDKFLISFTIGYDCGEGLWHGSIDSISDKERCEFKRVVSSDVLIEKMTDFVVNIPKEIKE